MRRVVVGWVCVLASCGGCDDPGGGPPGCPSALVCGQICCGAQQRCQNLACVDGRPCSSDADCPAPSHCDLPRRICAVFDPTCEKRPSGGFHPVESWVWSGGGAFPDFNQVMMAPIVVPLSPPAFENATPPAVVFNSIRWGANQEADGRLRAVDGATGTELFSSPYPINGLSGIAAADLDGDGKPELVTGRLGGGLVALRTDGSVLWETQEPRIIWGAVAIAEMDGQDPLEVVAGNTLIDGRTGAIRCKGAFGDASNGVGPLSAVADVDGDGLAEIITGNTIYDVHCQPKPGFPIPFPDGYVGVANMLGGPEPEIVVVGSSQLRVQSTTGVVLWGPVPLPQGGRGGPPTLADMDGDGMPEIGIAGLDGYAVFNPRLGTHPLWTSRTQDHSSSVTGSAVFDFQGDGRAEVVYADECYLRAFDGPTGAILFERPNPSCTTHEYPVIASISGDGRASVLSAANDTCDIPCPYGRQSVLNRRGLVAWRDRDDQWVNTRSIWNEHTYHVTNVTDAGKIPFPEPPNWATPGLNNFRQNVQGQGIFLTPDLVAENPGFTLGCPSSIAVAVDVANRGAIASPAHVPVALYANDGAKLRLIAVGSTSRRLLPGESERITLVDPKPRDVPTHYVVRVDDDGASHGISRECREDNNQADVDGLFCPIFR